MANLIQEDYEAPAAGRGPGIDWVTERTFETGTSSIEFEIYEHPHILIFPPQSKEEAAQYCEESGLKRCRTNHNYGVRVISLRCSHHLCPVRMRLLKHFQPPEGVEPSELESIFGEKHNHNIAVVPIWGLNNLQKEVILLCIERGLSAPKKVSKTTK